MLREDILKDLKEKIKSINKEKLIEDRLQKMIDLSEDTRGKINDELDDVFSEVNLKKRKLNLEN